MLPCKWIHVLRFAGCTATALDTRESCNKFAAFIGRDPLIVVKNTHAEKVYPERLVVPVDAQSGTLTDAPRASLVENAAMLIDAARERLPLWAWVVLIARLVTPVLAGSAAHPSAVPDSNPQFIQLGPEVHVTGGALW